MPKTNFLTGNNHQNTKKIMGNIQKNPFKEIFPYFYIVDYTRPNHIEKRSNLFCLYEIWKMLSNIRVNNI